ncbi:MAG: C10 family peptidase [Bacteroidales bacterium]|nr:C10 family peptidase [Bacteroidales bacterium]
MFKKTLLILTAIAFSCNLSAGNIDATDAAKAARAFMHSRLNSTMQVDFSSVNPVGVSTIDAGAGQIYAVNFSSGGYVLVAGTEASVPVLGYAFEGSYTGESLPPSFVAWMEGYKQQVNDLVSRNVLPTAEISEKWTYLMNYHPELQNNLRVTTQVSPLLSTTWDQGARYNELCPEDNGGPGGHVWSGCVATAMSQVINYWRFPLQGTGSHGYYSDYGYLFVNFGESTYDYNQMNPNIGGENNFEMAEIQYHCGVAVDMMYSPNGSGAYSWDAVQVLEENFGYSSQISLELKEDYSDSQWADLLMENLDNGWPMYYHGFGSGGHAFNVDGYQGTDYFHFNWGWSGSYNGYYYLNNLNPGGNNFSEGQGAIVNFIPGNNYPYYCNGVTTLTRHNGTLEDGSGPVDPYVAGLNCGWLIAPEDSISNLTLIFDKFDVSQGVDVLNVYDGPDAGYPLLGSFTGSAMPPSLAATGDRMYIEFLTSGDQGSGWKAHFNSTIVSYCSGLTTITEPEGTITDGSSGRPYHNNSVCKYKIAPEGATSITISFNHFDTEPANDLVKVYDYVTQTLIGSYSGSELPEEIVVPSSKAYVLFVTNNDVQGDGWEFDYTSTVTGIEENNTISGNLKLRSFPNPAKDWLRIELSSREATQVEMNLVTTDGRVVLVPEIQSVAGNRTVMLDISRIPDGIYFLKYTSGEGSGIRKVLISR